MSLTVSLSVRVSPQVRDRLTAEAQDRGLPLGTYARDLLSGAAALEAPPGDGAVANEVACVFAHLGPEAGLRREVCMALARTVEQGGTAGIAAGRALIDEVRVTQMLYRPEPEDLDDEAAGDY